MPSSKIFNQLPTSLILNIEGREFIIKTPNLGQIIDIESNKQLFSNNMYPSLVRSNLNSSSVAVDLIELSAVFTALLPDFKEVIKVKSVFDLDIIASKMLLKEYKEKFIPWYGQILDILQSLEEDKSEEEEDGPKEKTSEEEIE